MADNKKASKIEDEELDELLDDALEDFEKISIQSSKATTSKPNDVEDPPMETLWNEKIQRSQAFDVLEKIFKGEVSLNCHSEAIIFQNIAAQAQACFEPDSENKLPEIDPQFQSSIMGLLQGMNQGQESLQQPFSADDVAGMFSNMNMSDTEGNAFLPFMQGMMQSLLSAEVLLPSLKEIVRNYPTWLEENESKISVEDKERYENQLKLMQEVVSELEKEKSDDSAEVKKQRFDIVLERMQKMQELGQPPSDLVGEGELPTNLEALPGAEQCSIM